MKTAHLLAVSALFALSMLFVSCQKEVDGVKIDTMFDCGPTFAVGASIKFQATVSPDNAKDKSVTWSSSDESVATITKEGQMLAVGIGTATISCTTENGKFSDSMEISVVENYAADVAGKYIGTITIDNGTPIDDISLNITGYSTPGNKVMVSIDAINMPLSCEANITFENEIFHLAGEETDDVFPIKLTGTIDKNGVANFLFNADVELSTRIFFEGERKASSF